MSHDNILHIYDLISRLSVNKNKNINKRKDIKNYHLIRKEEGILFYKEGITILERGIYKKGILFYNTILEAYFIKR